MTGKPGRACSQAPPGLCMPLSGILERAAVQPCHSCVENGAAGRPVAP